MTRIVLADDHHIIRKGLRTLLSSEIDFEIIGEASDGLRTVEVAEHLQPDVLILDLMMPGLNGLKVTARLAKTCPNTRIIILSMHSNEAYICEALKSGAKAYVLKDNTVDELITAIRQVNAGFCYLSSKVPEKTLQILNENSKPQIATQYLHNDNGDHG